MALEILDDAVSNGGSPHSGDAPLVPDAPVPRPSWRGATLEWPARSGLSETPTCGGCPLTSLHAELWLKVEMLCTSASSARRRLDAARGLETAAAAKIRALRKELEASRQVRSRPTFPPASRCPPLFCLSSSTFIPALCSRCLSSHNPHTFHHNRAPRLLPP